MKLAPEQKRLFDALTPLQKEIATNTLKGMKPIDAYRASSGKARTDEARYSAASEILRNPKVCEFLDSVREAQVSEAIVSRQEVLETLSRLIRTNLSDLIEWASYEVGQDDAGRPIKQTVWRIRDSVLQDPEALASIAEVTASKDGIKIKQHSRLQAIKQIVDMQGWDAPKKQELDLSSPDNSLTPQPLDASKLSTSALQELAGIMNAEEPETNPGT